VASGTLPVSLVTTGYGNPPLRIPRSIRRPITTHRTNGFGWHINRLQVGDPVFRAYSAGGNGGQIVVAIPDLDLVVSINGGSHGEFTKWYRWGLQLVPQYIIPALSQKDERNQKVNSLVH